MFVDAAEVHAHLRRARCHECGGRVVASVGGAAFCKKHLRELPRYLDNLALETARQPIRRIYR